MDIKTGLIWLVFWLAGAFDVIGVYHVGQQVGLVPINLSEDAAREIWAQYQQDHIGPDQKAALKGKK